MSGFPAQWVKESFQNSEGGFDDYAVVYFHLEIRRRTLYYFNNLIIPCILIGKLFAKEYFFGEMYVCVLIFSCLKKPRFF